MIPLPAEVRQIFNETYNTFYKKWINPDTVYDPDQLLKEARSITQKYDCDLCRNMVADLIVCIEEERRRQGNVNTNNKN